MGIVYSGASAAAPPSGAKERNTPRMQAASQGMQS
jgi:hypothetical protein